MATVAVRGVISALARSDTAADAALLRRFVAGRDEAAFTALVRRYGPLVLAACRRVVADSHLAEDAFQAVFVVLARKAGAIDPTRPLGPWLYGVAYRVALRARTMIGRRRKRETLTNAMPEVAHTQPPVNDLSAVIDEEIAKLSAVCREAVVLCELQGLSRKDAAKRLGVAEGTLSSRLAAGRKALANQLRKRGVVAGAGFLGATVVPSELLAATVAVSTGKAELGTHLLRLVEGAAHMTLLHTLKLAVVAVVLAAGGFGLWRSAESNAAPVPRVPDGGRIWLHDYQAGALVAYTESGEKDQQVKLPADQLFLGVTPDRAQILYVPLPPREVKEGVKTTYHLRPFGEGTRGTDTGIPFRFGTAVVSHWTRDGTRFLRDRHDGAHRDDNYEVVDLTAKTVTALKVPRNFYPVCWTPDEKQFLTVGPGDETGMGQRKYLLTSGEEPVELKLKGEVELIQPALASDGKTLLFHGRRYDPPADPNGEPYYAVFRLDPEAEKLTEVMHEPGQDTSLVVPSPDGKRLAVLWDYQSERNTTSEVDRVHLTVGNADGTARTTVTLRDRAKGHNIGHFSGYDLLGWFPTRNNAPVPKATRLVLSISGKHDGTTFYDRIVAVDPANGEFATITDKGYRGRVSPDGGTLVFEHDNAVWNVSTDGSNNPGKLLVDGGYGGPVYSRDGKHLYVSRLKSELGLWRHETTRYAADGSDPAPVKLPEGEAVLDVSPDGKTFLTRSRVLPTVNRSVLYAMEAEGKNRVQLSPDGGFNEPARFSPDGKRAVFVRNEKGTNSVWVVGADGKNSMKVFEEAGGYVEGVCWSPDGERVAVIAADLGEKGLIPFGRTDGRWRVELVTADGKEKTTLPLKLDEVRSIRSPDWSAGVPHREAKPDARKRNAPVPKAAPPEGVILVSRPSHQEPDKLVEVLDTTGKSRGHLKLGELLNVHQSRVSPDGTKLAFVRFLPLSGADPNSRGKYAYPEDIYVVDLPLKGPPKEAVIKGVIDPTIAWAADGKTLFVSSIPKGTDVSQEAVKGTTIPKRTVRYDVAAKTEQVIALPDGHAVQDVSPDGKALLTRTRYWGGGFDPSRYSTYLVPLDTLKPKRIGDEDDGFAHARFSPSGDRVVGIREDYTASKEKGVFVADLKRGQVDAVPLPEQARKDMVLSVAWAPDGKRLAVLWRERVPGGGRAGGGAPGGGGLTDALRITTLDADGKNAKTIREYPADEWHYQIEWADPKLPAAEKEGNRK